MDSTRKPPGTETELTTEEMSAFIERAGELLEPYFDSQADVEIDELNEYLQSQGIGPADTASPIDVAHTVYARIPLKDRYTGETTFHDPYLYFGDRYTQMALAKDIRGRSQKTLGDIREQAYGEAYPRLTEANLSIIGRLTSKWDPSDLTPKLIATQLDDTDRHRILARNSLHALIDDHIDGDQEPTTDLSAFMADLTIVHAFTVLSGKKNLFGQMATKLVNLAEDEMQRSGLTPDAISTVSKYLQNATERTAAQATFVIQRDNPKAIPRAMRGIFMKEVSDLLLAERPMAEQCRSAMIDILTTTVERSMPTPTAIKEEYLACKALVKYFGVQLPEPPSQAIASEKTPTFDITQLDWQILPPGTLEANAREIINEAQHKTTAARIDLNRLTLLESLREAWGTDACYYTRGQLRNRKAASPDDADRPDQYIILVLQEYDDQGQVLREHAIAESPIAGHNSLYMYRPDAAAHAIGWRKVMSLTKAEALEIGARPLPHRTPQGEDPNRWMLQKVQMLLNCPAEDFNRLSFSGRRGDGTVRTRLIGGTILREAVE